jgi:4-diphosphocytidyl-2-C-methyl-D-erythritol kinase
VAEGRVTIAAPAKVNLYLAVGPRRADGYHELETVMQTLDLHDTVTLEPAPSLDVTCSPSLDLPGETNLAAVAARTLGGLLGRSPDVAIDVCKRIPAGGGLGGGSSDAAAVLRGLATLWGLSADDPRMRTAAAEVGADVPFFLIGGCALMAGRGDVLVRHLPSPSLHIALVNPGVPVPTAAAYAALDEAPPVSAPGADALLEALDRRDPSAVGAALFDGMTAAAVGLVPAVSDALALVTRSAGVLGACMAGSGSTVFGVFSDASAAEAAAAAARERGWWGAATCTRSAGDERPSGDMRHEECE